MRRLIDANWRGTVWPSVVVAIVTNLPSILEQMNRLMGAGPASNSEKHETAARQLAAQEEAAGIDATGEIARARDYAIKANVAYQNALTRALEQQKREAGERAKVEQRKP